MKYAIVKDGVIKNLVEWDGLSAWQPPEGATAHEFAEGVASIGWPWNDGAPIDPNPPEPPPEIPELTAEEKLARAGLTVDELKQLLGLD